MRMIVVGLGIQGHKRQAIAGKDVVANVDPYKPEADYKDIRDVPLNLYDGAFVCTPDQAKQEILEYLLTNGKHLLVEKPLLAKNKDDLIRLMDISRSKSTTCYTAYNHRFEPHIVNLKNLLDSGELGRIYMVRLFYGNGTARDVRLSDWRDQGTGVLPDLASHMLDMLLFWFGDLKSNFLPWNFNRFENRAFDHFIFGTQKNSTPMFSLEGTLLSWRNNFAADVYAESGSAHIQSLCKWGPTTFSVRKRVLPSGKPDTYSQTLEQADPTWVAEYEHFKKICAKGETNLQNDIWISTVLMDLVGQLRNDYPDLELY
jgi:scyllo-inositol 2-dehydrogenase (NADP+)